MLFNEIHGKLQFFLLGNEIEVREGEPILTYPKLFLPDNEIKVREGEHDDPEEGGQGAVQDRREHVLQR